MLAHIHTLGKHAGTSGVKLLSSGALALAAHLGFLHISCCMHSPSLECYFLGCVLDSGEGVLILGKA